jgi:asparagine synthase (glutamine-hydrolysing)
MPEGLVDRMGQSMLHRDWYAVDSWSQVGPAVGLGRIGIGIFNRHIQPVWNAARSHALVMSGEIVRPKHGTVSGQTDEQVVLSLYETHGTGFVKHLEGTFVCALWDQSQQELLIANDRFGLYPLHFAHVDHSLVFAPEIKGILHAPGVSRTLDMVAIAEYLRFQMFLGTRTFLADVKILRGGTLLRYRPAEDQLSLEVYWDFGHIPARPSPLPFEEAVEESTRLLRAAFQKRCDGRIGLYLSGGMDSRLILGYASRHQPGLPSITYGARHCNDVIYGTMLAQRMGSDHHYQEFVDGRWVEEVSPLHLELTEGMHSWIHSHGMSTLALARQVMDINLTGLGGDTMSVIDPQLAEAQDDDAFLARYFAILLTKNTWPSLDEGEERLLYSPRCAGMIGSAFEALRHEMERHRHLDYHRRALSLWFEADRRMFQYYTVFGRSHVEQRFPFFDYDYFDFMASLPLAVDQERRLRRAVIVAEMPRLAAVPYDKDGLPIMTSETSRLLNKAMTKVGRAVRRRVGLKHDEPATLYADYENWLRRELRPWGEDLLLGDRICQRGIFSPTFLRSLWVRHQSGSEINSIGKVAPIMTLELCLRRFHD